ncbi:MAG: 30S ribosome-binding factor RbfA [Gammaproteobacteria bacterium]
MKSPEFSRIERVQATVKRVLANPLNEIARELDLGILTITNVNLSPDLRRAEIFVSTLSDKFDDSTLLDHLSQRTGELQHEMANQLRTKRTPVLKFRLDHGMARSARINELLGDSIKDAGEA